MLSILLSLLVLSAQAGQPNHFYTHLGPHSGGSGLDTDTLSKGIGGLLDDKTTEAIRQAGERRSAQIEGMRSAAQAGQVTVDRIAAQNEGLKRSSLAPPPPMPSLGDLKKGLALPPKGVIDKSKIPDPDESQLPYQFISPDGMFKEEITQIYKDLYKVEPKFGKQKFAKNLGFLAVEEADQSFAHQQTEEAQFYKELAQELLDIVVGLDPVSGLGRSAFELFMGKNLVTGIPLSATERSFAFLGVATGGSSRFIGQAARGLLRLSQRAGHLIKDAHVVEEVIHGGSKIIDSAGKVGALGAEKVVQTFTEKAAEGKNVFSKLLTTAKRTNEKQMEAVLEDGSKVLFRRDVGEHAHALGGAYRGQGPINHYNIEIHVPKSDGGFKAKQNYHLILDNEFNVIDFMK